MEKTMKFKTWTAILLFQTFFNAAVLVYLLGISIFDVMSQTSTDITRAWILFMSQGLGNICGNIFTMMTIERTEKWFNVSAIFIVGAVGTLMFGISRNFVLTNIAIFLQGFSCDAMEVIGFAICLEVFGVDSPTVLQLIASGMDVGTAISPAIIAPYLSQEAVKHNGKLEDSLMLNNLSLKGTEQIGEVILETSYWIPYAILASIVGVTGIGFFTTAVCRRINVNTSSCLHYERVNLNDPIDKGITIKPDAKLVEITLVSAMMFLSCGIMNVQCNLLTDYVVEVLKIGTATPAYMICAMQVMFFASRIIASITTYRFGATPPLGVAILVFLASAVVLLCLPRSLLSIWIFVIIQGLGTGPIYAGVLGWVQDKYTISDFYLPWIVMGGTIGHIVFGMLISYLMTNYGVFIFEIAISLTAFGFLFTFVIMEIMARKRISKTVK